MRTYLVLLLLSLPLPGASRYAAEKTTVGGVGIVLLRDTTRGVEVSIVPAFGNRAYELKVHGQNLLYFPLPDVASLAKGGGKSFNGIPFLAPWANRLAGAGFWANGRHYGFNGDLGSVHVDPTGIAMHGMVTASSYWQVTEASADAESAHVTSRLEFWRYPELMANWPFAHEYEMTYRLHDGVLEVRTTVKNLSAETMPVALGFHPYFNIPGVPRGQQSIHIPARKHVETDPRLVATGELTENALPSEISLRDHTFDDGFTDLVRDGNDQAVFSLSAGLKRIEVVYGPKYQVAVVFAPPGQNFVCFEPMAAITDGINLAHAGKYSALQTVAPGATWSESFFIRSGGF